MKPTIEQYATKEEIIHALAPYKQDEVVTLLGKVTMVTKLSHREKKYEKGTKVRIIRCFIPMGTKIPKIPMNELNDYCTDDGFFTYIVTPVLSDECDNNDIAELYCKEGLFERGDIALEEIPAIFRQKNKYTKKQKVSLILSMVFTLIVVCPISFVLLYLYGDAIVDLGWWKWIFFAVISVLSFLLLDSTITDPKIRKRAETNE